MYDILRQDSEEEKSDQSDNFKHVKQYWLYFDNNYKLHITAVFLMIGSSGIRT